MLDQVRPHYAKEFRCIGTACEDTCCHGLDVVIDKVAYEKYQAPRFQQVIEHFEVVKSPTDAQYARIKLTGSLTCPFLTPDRLCGVQQQHGEQYLSEICRSYPRITRRIDGLLETALCLSCPEAARLVLLNPQLTAEEAGDHSRYHQSLRVRPESSRANGSPHQFLWEIRSFTLLLLRDRTYALWQRLFLLGLFCKRLDELIASRQMGLVPELLKTYAEIADKGSVRSLMDEMPTQTTLQLAVVMEVIRRQLEMTDAGHVHFRECIQDFLQGIGSDAAGLPIESLAPAYGNAYAHYYHPFTEQYPFLLENYLINQVFRTRFPFGVSPNGTPSDAQAEFLTMCAHYGVMKGLLIGMAGHYGESLSTAHVVKLVSTFARAVEHCPGFLGLRGLGLDNTNAAAILLKN